ncbi:hypothetical protein [Caenimonas sp. SL110]|uniref:hypothetical protein n=1 Tax=Caenimonas sp. SL110 TaxID=1450524 RepID=UPI0006543BB6|nr:hypothetical protein [Caenimonas sp. SL110]
MALTMTRTRTQTALTSLCRMIANVHGELEFVDWALRFRKQGRKVLEARRLALLGRREALHTTLRVFDPELDPASIGAIQEWLKPYGRKFTLRAVGKYVKVHLSP